MAKGELDEPALVVPLLGPGVREQDEDLVHGAGWDLLLEHLDRVMADEAHVVQLPGLKRQHHAADAGAVHLDPEEVALRIRGGEVEQVVPIAEADLDRARGGTPEQRSGIEQRGREFHPVLGPQLLQRALLGGRDAPGANDKGTDRVWVVGQGHKRTAQAGLRS